MNIDQRLMIKKKRQLNLKFRPDPVPSLKNWLLHYGENSIFPFKMPPDFLRRHQYYIV